MNYAKSFLDKLKSNFEDFDYFFDRFIESKTPDIRKSIKERWLLGKNPEGDIIGYYSFKDQNAYAIYKFQEVSSLAGLQVVDLTLTGSLGDKITLDPIDNGEYIIYSRDVKYNKIVEKYGEYNFNLSDFEKEQIINSILPYLIKEMYKNIF